MAIVGCVAALLLGASVARPDVSYFGQAQSFLKEFRGAPLLAANWEGRFAPYLFERGRFEPVIPRAVLAAHPTLDLYSPTPLSHDEILLAAQDSGKRAFAIFHYSTRSQRLTNLTPSQAEGRDNGGFCVSPKGGTISYHQDDRQIVASLDREPSPHLVTIGEPIGPAFDHCLWASESIVMGETGGMGTPSKIFRCERHDAGFSCSPLLADEQLDGFVDFHLQTDGTVGMIARRKGEEFRKSFTISKGRLIENPVSAQTGDVVEVADGVLRIGYRAQYRSTLPTRNDDPIQILRLRKIGSRFFAIAASETSTRTLAEYRHDRWVLFRYAGFAISGTAWPAKEVDCQSASGQHYQCFYFAPHEPRAAVLWLHGGPAENVSPRFNPYFYALNQMGLAVLALNYPGSTGQGSGYEASFHESELVDSLAAALAYLRAAGMRRIISWSVSAGARLQRHLLDHGLEIDGIVDQSGNDPEPLRTLARRRRVPYFSVRGFNDSDPRQGPYDFLYPDGHDITHAAQFAQLLEAVKPFLDSVAVGNPKAVKTSDGVDVRSAVAAVLEVDGLDLAAGVFHEAVLFRAGVVPEP